MDQASPQCMDDDSKVVAYPDDERLPKIVVHFSVMPGVTLTWCIEADSTLAVQGARIWLAHQFPLRSLARARRGDSTAARRTRVAQH